MLMPDRFRTLALTAALIAGCCSACAQSGPLPAGVPAAAATVSAAGPGQAAVAAPAPADAEPKAADSAAPESLLIGPGDLLHISILRESELDQKVRVLDSGEISP